MDGKINSINLFGEITPDTLVGFNNLLSNIKPDNGSICVNINSTGGDLSSAIAIHNLLINSPVKIKTHNIGEVSSAAIPVYLAGSERSMETIAKFVFHPFSISISGSISYGIIEEKLKILQIDVERYSHIVKTQASMFCREYDIEEILKYKCVIVSNVEEALRLNLTTR